MKIIVIIAEGVRKKGMRKRGSEEEAKVIS